MRRLQVALGIFDIALACSLLWIHSVTDWNAANGFTWGLPLLIAAALALIGGIYTLTKKNWGWTITGLVAAGVAWIYYLVLAWWISYWSMA